MKFALIGCGAQGMAYARAAAELGFEIVACADPRRTSAKKAAALVDAKTSIDGAETIALRTVDALLLCSPADTLPAYLRAAAKAHKSVLSAAPIYTTGAQTAFDAARAAGIHLYCAYNTRVAPELEAAITQINGGAIGRPGFIRLVRVGSSSAKAVGNALEVLLPADLDWLIDRFGSRLRIFVQATRAPGLSHAAATITFRDGPIIQWVGTCRAGGESPRSTIEVCGTGGMIQFTTDDLVLEAAGGRRTSPQRRSPLALSAEARHLARFASLLESRPAETSFMHDDATLRAIYAAMQSAHSGREVRL